MQNGAAADELVVSAWAANRAYAEELQRTLDALTEEEQELQTNILTLRQRLAMRRAERAMAALGCGHASSRIGNCDGDQRTGVDAFAREPESRYKRVGVVPRSFIRQKQSFFHSSPEKAPSATEARRKKRRRSTNDDTADAADQIATQTEPSPNADTLFLRQHSHAAFIATPSKAFSAKERATVAAFVRDHVGADGTGEIPLEVWNRITAVARPPIHRSGFECKLRWDLHDNPSLRLCAWTKDEDRALKELASGRADPSIVNNWAEIAKRMPLPGRPPVHCLTRYMTKLCASNLNDKFTPEEDALLRQAVEVFGERWSTIADLMDGRIAEQLRHRWQLSLSPNVKLGKFSVVEDRRLLLALYAYHDREDAPFQRESVVWHQICHHIPGRPPPPVRDRFLNSLNPEVTFRDWMPQEDARIKATVQRLGFDSVGLWPRLAAELGNRTDNQVARRARHLLPMDYKQYQEAKKTGDRAALPAVFRRPSLGRRDPNTSAAYAKRSSYNGNEEDNRSDSLQPPSSGEGEVWL